MPRDVCKRLYAAICAERAGAGAGDAESVTGLWVSRSTQWCKEAGVSGAGMEVDVEVRAEEEADLREMDEKEAESDEGDEEEEGRGSYR